MRVRSATDCEQNRLRAFESWRTVAKCVFWDLNNAGGGEGQNISYDKRWWWCCKRRRSVANSQPSPLTFSSKIIAGVNGRASLAP